MDSGNSVHADLWNSERWKTKGVLVRNGADGGKLAP